MREFSVPDGDVDVVARVIPAVCKPMDLSTLVGSGAGEIRRLLQIGTSGVQMFLLVTKSLVQRDEAALL